MKPAGRERDIEIAKLKGWKFDGEMFKIGEPDIDGYYDIDNCIPIDDLTNWSTNRNDAWELWDEICDKTYILPQHATKKYTCYADDTHIVIISMKNDKEIHIKGQDFADCVSQAWLIWKQNLERN